MRRETMVERLEGERGKWDLVIIGGGATGLGTAVDAASRGYRTLLVEQHDFGKATSSRSTKLVHGGVRYLKQGNVALVLGALRERGILQRNAPHIIHKRGFVVPAYSRWDAIFYGAGLRVYDILAAGRGFGRSHNLTRAETVDRLPTIETDGLRGGVLYYDGQFDDARLLVHLAETAVEHGSVVLNYFRVTQLVKTGRRITGLVAVDTETGKEHTILAKVVVNATGVFTDAIRRMDDSGARPMVRPSQGVHIVLDRSFLPGDHALMVPKTSDGRVLFAVPWHDRVVIGTTDTPVDDTPIEPRPFAEELEFLLDHAARYLTKDPSSDDVLCTFAGLRPLVKRDGSGSTAALSRDHTLDVAESGLLTITGGKWTTYRKMAEDTVNRAVGVGGLDPRPCVTSKLRLHGYHDSPETLNDLAVYGSDTASIRQLMSETPTNAELIHPKLPVHRAQIVWAARREMARSVEDALARRTRCLLLDARASIEAAPLAAGILAAELGKDDAWKRDQVAAYRELAEGYLVS